VSANAQTDFVTFESGPVRPLALSPDGTRLFIANIPEAHLEVWDLTPASGPEPLASVPVGLEPVAVAALSNDEVWVVNHLSDSISVVSVAGQRVTRTLLVATSRATSSSRIRRARRVRACSSRPRTGDNTAPTRRSPACRVPATRS